MWQNLADRITGHLGNPGRGPIGWYVKRLLRTVNEVLERSAVDLCEIEPHHTVLEVGFGTGIGLRRACQKLKGGTGKLYGIDLSEPMVQEATNSLKDEIAEGRVELVLSAVENHPFGENKFDRVFHANCYYFWEDPKIQVGQIFRAMKPGSLMVTTLDLERIEAAKERGFLLKNTNTDPERYMKCLESVGFKKVAIRDLVDKQTGKQFQAILAFVEELDNSSESKAKL